MGANRRRRTLSPTPTEDPLPTPRRTKLLLLAALAGVALTAGCATRPNRPTVADESARLANATRAWAAGDALKNEGKFAPAADAYRQALSQREDLGAVWNNLGICLMSLDKHREAGGAFQRAAELLPSDPRPFENLGTLYLSRDYPEKAYEFFAKSLARDPNHLPALRGAVQSAKLTNHTEDEDLDRLNRAILIETDPDWLRIMQQERLVLKRVIDDRRSRASLAP